MIEFCTKRRMILAIIILIVVSSAVLLMENYLSPDREIKDFAAHSGKGNATYHCWEVSKVKVMDECQKCSAFDAKAHKICRETGYREKVQCSFKDGTVRDDFRSCPKNTWAEERDFWLFECTMALIGLGSYGVVSLRQKRLDRMLMEKVHKQIASGV